MSFGELPNRYVQLRGYRVARFNAKARAMRRAMKGITGKREHWMGTPRLPRKVRRP